MLPQPWFPFGINFPKNSIALQENRYRQPYQTLFPQPYQIDNRWPQNIYPQTNYPQGSYQLQYRQQNRYPQIGYIQDRFPQRGYIHNRYPQSNINRNQYSQSNSPQTGYPSITGPQNWNSQTNGPQHWFPIPSTTQNKFLTTISPLNAIPQDNYPERLTQTAAPPIDLSRDTYVNDIMAQSGATVNPDAEIFDVKSLPVSNTRFRYPR